MHNEQYSQRNKILKLSTYSLTPTSTYKNNNTYGQATQTEAYCGAICQEMLGKTRTFCGGGGGSYGSNVNYHSTSKFPPTDLPVGHHGITVKSLSGLPLI